MNILMQLIFLTLVVLVEIDWYPTYTGMAATQPANTSDGVNTYNSNWFMVMQVVIRQVTASSTNKMGAGNYFKRTRL